MRPELQLLSRHSPIFDAEGPTLVVDPPDADILALTTNPTRFEFWVRHRDVARMLTPKATIHTGLWAASGRFQQAIVFLPKGRQAQNMTFAQVHDLLSKNTSVFIVGANHAGMKSAVTHIRHYIGDVRTLDTARRCTLVEAKVASDRPGFDEADWQQQWTTRAFGQTVDIVTYPGTFSAGALDAGTAELLTALEGEKVGPRILDLGCGSGVLGTLLAKAQPTGWVQLVDVHAAAIASATATLKRNRIANAACVASDWYEAATGPFQTIVCNPPFHQGISTDVSMIGAVIAGAPSMLNTGGQLWLVANRHLPYIRDLQAAFRDVAIVRETTKFRVYRCASPVATSESERQAGKRSGKLRKR
ncbi:MAG: methyltransferase [Myxococcota bacterium]